MHLWAGEATTTLTEGEVLEDISALIQLFKKTISTCEAVTSHVARQRPTDAQLERVEGQLAELGALGEKYGEGLA
jgi:hypothetical protein